ncbi:hypothetical protein BDW22DRAFT_157318 [Trametopsis cervina]|nr:hypothetical protein BDW22DRAFT_157318 [Trametopsis cervina]
MDESLHDLLTKLSWDPSRDTLFLAGDVLAKSTHATSLSVLKYLYTNHINAEGRQVIYPVRGNHDQMVVQWRAWRDWFERLTSSSRRHHRFLPLTTLSNLLFSTRPTSAGDKDAAAIHTGQDFLNLIEAEWLVASTSSSSPPDPEEYIEVARKRARGTWRAAWWARIPETPTHGPDKKAWKMFSDHYWLARDLTREEAAWLIEEVPLVNWIRSLHMFVVHAGILPADSTRDMEDRRQPLARVPGVKRKEGQELEREVSWRIRRGEAAQKPLVVGEDRYVNGTATPDIGYLRGLQEEAILSQVPQNTDPWVVLNMRSVKDSGEVTRNGDNGTPWSDIWKDAMDSCKGFGLPGEARLIEPGFTSENGEEGTLDDLSGLKKHKKYKLRCYPSTVVYGHAATRGLDVKRWSFGVDTGCLYGRRLTSLVLRAGRSGQDEDEEEEEEEDERGVLTKKIDFGDKGAGVQARLVSVRCPNPDEDEDLV